MTTEAIALNWLKAERRFVQALLVEVDGSAPLPTGAMMLIGSSRDLEGSLTGGCVEAAVVTEAEALLAGGHGPRMLTYGISDELAGEVGLACGGTVHVLISELRGTAAVAEMAVLQAHVDGRNAAIGTVLDGPGTGARLAVVDGEIIGSLGQASLLDHHAAREITGQLYDAKTTIRRFGADGATLSDDLRVHIRAYAPPPRMIIFGAIDFSAALAPIAAQVGYDVEICDARDRFARSKRFSTHATVRTGWPEELMRDRHLSPRDVVLVFTHDARFDEPALLSSLQTEAGFIGALGSRRTTADRMSRLRAAGVSEPQLQRIHAPCGLDIGSRTPEETAISVMAEIIASRTSRAGLPLATTSGPIHGRD